MLADVIKQKQEEKRKQIGYEMVMKKIPICVDTLIYYESLCPVRRQGPEGDPGADPERRERAAGVHEDRQGQRGKVLRVPGLHAGEKADHGSAV